MLNYIESLSVELELANKKSLFYKNLNATMLRAEAINKSRRYGREFYAKNFLKNNEISTAHMNTFIYLRNAELSANELRDKCMSMLARTR